MRALLKQIRACAVCAAHLPHGPRPILAASSKSRVLIIGQAPGVRAHDSKIPWNDASGDQLRIWLEMDKEGFYNADNLAFMPMGFCYPGTGRSGDLPPRPECAPLWHARLRAAMPAVQLTLLIGQYAQQHYLGAAWRGNLTETVRAFREMPPGLLPLPHPSPRNRIWQRRNPWFETDLLPVLRRRLKKVWA